MKKLKEKLNAKLSKNGGFTLVEMLIVIAIIAVLIAISIPVVTNELENAREAADAANLRSAYAVVMIDAVQEGGSTTKTVDVVLTQTKNGWNNTNIKNIGGVDMDDIPSTPGATVTVSYDAGSDTAKFTAN